MFVTNNSDEVAMEHSRTPTPSSLFTHIYQSLRPAALPRIWRRLQCGLLSDRIIIYI